MLRSVLTATSCRSVVFARRSRQRFKPFPVLYTAYAAYVIVLMSSSFTVLVEASGQFQLRLISYRNSRGWLADGTCCGDGSGSSSRDRICADSSSCNVVFSICLREHQVRVTDAQQSLHQHCTFGNWTTSQARSGNYLVWNNTSTGSGISSTSNTAGSSLGSAAQVPLDDGSRIDISFDFAWTRSFTLILEAQHEYMSEQLMSTAASTSSPASSGFSSASDSAATTTGETRSSALIERAVHSGVILPGQDWHTILHDGHRATIRYRVRVKCDPFYFNTTCTKFCRPRNDKFGHYSCNSNGDKICVDGWIGPNCDIAECKTGCHSVHGSCERPGECRCAYGWQGELCNQCVPYPGCKHGSCNGVPWQCDCYLNWGGMLCDQDLNYCGRHSPCNNGGTCHNTAPSDYQCECPTGFAGRNCEIERIACAAHPCFNGAQCLEHRTQQYQCICNRGWTGRQCDINIDECQSNPCLNGGQCVDDVNGYKCQCQFGWQGSHCQLDSDECRGRPCINAASCQNTAGDYVCSCLRGWTGKNCDTNIDDCQGQCHNGGTCVDMVDGFYCSCRSGYHGELCQLESDECASQPCRNGGICRDLDNAYICICQLGYAGIHCEIDTDLCDPNPCFNDAVCYNMHNGYFCQCNEYYDGQNCTVRRDSLVTTLTHADSCTMLLPSSNLTNPSSSLSSGDEFVRSSVCGQHGSCVNWSNGQFHCVCDTGYTGAYCHENINDCASDACLNHGTCVDGVNSYQCICADGWEGINCGINLDDCLLNPCRNNGTCVDLTSDFTCICPPGWKGKTCSLRDTHCDDDTCRNGGTCVDHGDTFACVCPEGWRGRICHIAKNSSCDSSPCRNGATCVNSGDSFTCLCRDGFDGLVCQHNLNDCNPYPCFNGGHCIDGDNWFMCACPPGFAPPDCRININECLSQPCAYGSTCIDGIGEYKCLCPPGRTGLRCHTVIDADTASTPCLYQRRLYQDQAIWEHDCNSCKCNSGLVRCTKLWCGPRNCLSYVNATTTSPVSCSSEEVCIVDSDDVSCLTPPCLPVGRCRRVVDGVVDTSLAAGVDGSRCLSGTPLANSGCVQLKLTFNRQILPVGVSAENVCEILRQIRAIRELSQDFSLYLRCDILAVSPDVVLVTLSVSAGGTRVESVGVFDVKSIARKASSYVVDVIRNNHRDNILIAVIDIQLQILSTPSTAQSTTFNGLPSYMVPIICSLLVAVGLLSVLAFVIWYKLSMRRWLRKHNDSMTSVQQQSGSLLASAAACTRSSHLQLSDCSSVGIGAANNESPSAENKDNAFRCREMSSSANHQAAAAAITRYHNTLYDYVDKSRQQQPQQQCQSLLPNSLSTDADCSDQPLADHFISIEKYEKSPARRHAWSTSTSRSVSAIAAAAAHGTAATQDERCNLLRRPPDLSAAALPAGTGHVISRSGRSVKVKDTNIELSRAVLMQPVLFSDYDVA